MTILMHKHKIYSLTYFLKVKSNSGVRIQMKTKLAATKSVEADDSEPPTKMRKVVKDEEFYLDYATKDHNTEKGLVNMF